MSWFNLYPDNSSNVFSAEEADKSLEGGRGRGGGRRRSELGSEGGSKCEEEGGREEGGGEVKLGRKVDGGEEKGRSFFMVAWW